jgi:hypothetical protein
MLRRLLFPDPADGGGGAAAVADPPPGSDAGAGAGGDGGAGGGTGGDDGAGGGAEPKTGNWESALEKFPGLEDDDISGGAEPKGGDGAQPKGEKPKPAGTVEKPKPGPQGVAPKPDPKPADGAKPVVPTFKTNKELRTWAEGVAADSQKIKTETETLRKEVATLRKNSKNTDVEALTRTNAELTKRVEDYEKEIRVSRYSSSAEYKEKYQTPIQTKTAKAFKTVQDLTVEIVDPNNPENKTSRPGTKADFQAIYAAPNRSAARKLAKQLFGDDADDVIRYRDEINDLVEAADEAAEKYKTQGHEAEQKTQAERLRENEARNAMWIEANKAYRENPKIARHFNDDPDDPEFTDLLHKGFEFVDEFFGPNRAKYTVQQQIVADTKIRHRSAAYPAAMHRLKKAEAALTAANETIATLRGSGPGGRGKSAGGGGGTVATQAADGDKNYGPDGKFIPMESRIDELPE